MAGPKSLTEWLQLPVLGAVGGAVENPVLDHHAPGEDVVLKQSLEQFVNLTLGVLAFRADQVGCTFYLDAALRRFAGDLLRVLRRDAGGCELDVHTESLFSG